MSVSNVAADFGGIDPNGEFKIVSVDATAGTVTVDTGQTATAASSTGSAVVSNRTFDFTGTILNATSANTDFITNGGTTTATDFASNSLKFSITVGSNTPLTFTYNSNPDSSQGQFNNLTNLASAISDSSNKTLSATVVNGRLYVSPADANDSVVFTNGNAAGSPTSTPATAGIDWVQELDLQNQNAAPSGTHFFNSLNGLATQINTIDPTNLTAVVNNATSAASITITEANPEQTIAFTDDQANASVLQELGFANLQPTAPGSGIQTTGTLNITYSNTDPAKDLSSGTIPSQYTHAFDVTVFDSQGNAHNLAVNLVKTAVNTWQVELTAVPATDVKGTLTGDGQLASGTLHFNGDGTLSPSSTGSIFGNININWTNGASPSTIKMSLFSGTSSNGLTQTNAGYSLQTASQNGSPVGQLTGVSIDSNGFVVASFSNGETQKEFQIPLANIANPDGLDGVTGNSYAVTLASGPANLAIAGSSGVGTFTPSALEESNVDLSTQLTNLIVAQQAYGANSKVLTIADQLLQELDQVIQG